MHQIPSGVDFADLLKKAVEEALKNRGNVNVLIAGKTGVGKSTLINSIFQGNLAEVGQGRPVTTNTREITKEGIPLSIFDTRGLEIAKFDETLSALEKFANDRSREIDPGKHLHVAWICISEDSRRLEEGEVTLAKMLDHYMPVIGVVTKSRADNGFKDYILEELPFLRNVIRVRAIKDVFEDGHELPPCGLKELVDLTIEVVPESVKNAFTAAQKVSLKAKINRSHKIVAAAAVTAAGIGAAPVPFADALGLVPTQVSMLAGISAVFGLEITTAFLGTLLSGSIVGAGGTVGGRILVANMLKMIPGAGTLVGGMISGSTAGALTALFGEAYIAALCTLLSSSPDNQPTAQQISDAFKVELQRKSFPSLLGN
ncbi:YcjF family protein [Nodosilinea nodulosa]|uniref:YcjF family protein n=1 Tax=Nodosilinea nodulosa TaxID=416001 RepID=UPI0002F51604|nr:DUF697 domain-containing protein [Nodosilinea nodulosa]